MKPKAVFEPVCANVLGDMKMHAKASDRAVSAIIPGRGWFLRRCLKFGAPTGLKGGVLFFEDAFDDSARIRS